MHLSLILVVASALVQSEVTARTIAQRSPTESSADSQRDADSTRVLRTARRAQATFESVRRRYLPREFGLAGHSCDVNIGRWCVWSGDDERQPPTESAHIIEARQRLLVILDSLATLRPGDEWIVSQQVRYLIEAKRFADAVAVAERCADRLVASYLCRSLAGLAYHDSGAVANADDAFTAALRAMPDSVRCRWTDLSVMLDGDIGSRYARLGCNERDDVADPFWRLGAPLFLVGDADWRNEFLARVAKVEIERDTRTPLGWSTDPRLREMTVRYGIGNWYSIEEPSMGSMREPVVASHDARGSGFNFLPAEHGFTLPALLQRDDWQYSLRASRTRYAPAYLKHLRQLEQHQLAIFRRGDSALVVAAYDVHEDTLLSRNPLEAGLFVAPVERSIVGVPRGSARGNAGAVGVLATMAPWRSLLVSVELFDRKTKTASRARYGAPLPPPESRARIALSDLLLFAPPPHDSIHPRLDDVLPSALATDRVSAHRPLGLYWETYGVRPEGEVFDVSLTIEGMRRIWLRRAAQRLRLASRTSPLRVQWKEVPSGADGVAARTVAVDLSRLAPGGYQIRLTVTPRGDHPAVTTREIVVER